MLISIDVKFNFDSARLAVCSAPQIFSKQEMSPFELSSRCSCHVFIYYNKHEAVISFLFRCKCLCSFEKVQRSYQMVS